jgi:membrane protein implicated in regulation of membrane protease activity
MCHLLLALPLVAVLAFWIWPLWLAAPVYAAVVVASGVLYLKIMQAMRRPDAAGVGELLQDSGEIVASDGSDIRVLVHGERWNARSPDALRVGDHVRVTGLEGMTLTVRRCERRIPGSKEGRTSVHGARVAGGHERLQRREAGVEARGSGGGATVENGAELRRSDWR